MSYLSLLFFPAQRLLIPASVIIGRHTVSSFSVLKIIQSTENVAQLVEHLPVAHGDSEFDSQHSSELGRHDGACL